jgi:dTDP-4-amino-4,6-dideoxygalactose transaminase
LHGIRGHAAPLPAREGLLEFGERTVVKAVIAEEETTSSSGNAQSQKGGSVAAAAATVVGKGPSSTSNANNSQTSEFERKLAEFTGARHAVAVVNGTAALHVALQIVGVKAMDEVLVPALSFVATANAVSHCGAFPHFLDSNKSTLGLDAEALASHLDFVSERTADGLRNKFTGRRISAIVPMHTFGHPVDMVSLMEVAARFSLPVVEDAA